MTLPNKLSLSRIFIIPFFLVALLVGGAFPEEPGFYAWFRLVALLFVIAASITDWLDGYIARKTGEVSTLGILLDPLADKLLVTSAFVAFVELQLFPSWLIIIILCREFLVTGLRTVAAKRGIVIAADRWGKHKTGWQLATIITTLVFLTAREFLRHYGMWENPLVSNWAADQIFHWTLQALLIITVILTLISGTLYLVRNRQLLEE
ncbi:CDP-diacylglycerol--glycerol-3-phosphate 3-phosphatidyltransferase [bacterium]|nr:CDP-diacylglycerol--glycerol-3-phosphate 3-phosphatidyltransferase [bacterium]